MAALPSIIEAMIAPANIRATSLFTLRFLLVIAVWSEALMLLLAR
jgi:hypothetical protein